LFLSPKSKFCRFRKGLPISIDTKKQLKTGRMPGTRSSSIIADQQTDDAASSGGLDLDAAGVQTRHMPTTLLVPNLRTQNVKLQTNFQHVIKTILMLAFLGQKKPAGKHLIKESAAHDLQNDLLQVQSHFGVIKEKQVRYSKHKLYIAQQTSRAQNEVLGLSNNLNSSQ